MLFTLNNVLLLFSQNIGNPHQSSDHSLQRLQRLRRLHRLAIFSLGERESNGHRLSALARGEVEQPKPSADGRQRVLELYQQALPLLTANAKDFTVNTFIC